MNSSITHQCQVVVDAVGRPLFFIRYIFLSLRIINSSYLSVAMMIISFIIPGIPYNEAVRYSFHIYHFIIVPSVILFCSLIQTSGLNRQRDSTKVSCICNKTSDTSAKRSSHLQKTSETFATKLSSHLQQIVHRICNKMSVTIATKRSSFLQGNSAANCCYKSAKFCFSVDCDACKSLSKSFRNRALKFCGDKSPAEKERFEVRALGVDKCASVVDH